MFLLPVLDELIEIGVIEKFYPQGPNIMIKMTDRPPPGWGIKEVEKELCAYLREHIHLP